MDRKLQNTIVPRVGFESLMGRSQQMLSLGSRDYVQQLILWMGRLRFRMSRRRTHDPVIAYHFAADRVRVLFAKDKEGSSADGLPLPSRLMIPPGTYCFEGENYDCSMPGLYRFSKPQERNEQRIVTDPQSAFGTGLFLTSLFVRGNRDDFKTLPRLRKKALHGFLINTCGPACQLARHLLWKAGFASRVVHTHTKDALNSFNNGHTMLEVYDDKDEVYRLIDVDKKCYFVHRDRGILDLLEFCYCIDTGREIEIRRVDRAFLVDWGGFSDVQSGFNYQFIEYLLGFDERTQIGLYRRIAAIPIIEENGRAYATSWGDPGEAFSGWKNWTLLSPEAFRERFYSKGG